MKVCRNWIPILGIFALALLFLNLPETPNPFGIFGCKTCTVSDPYLSLMGAGYFAALLAISLLFPAFPTPHVARGGLLWAILLAFTLTYLHLPSWCIVCLICHACHILMWIIWVFVPPVVNTSALVFRERLCLTLILPISIVALFSCLNLTFMAYNYKSNRHELATGLKPGDVVLPLTIKTSDDQVLIHVDTNDLMYIVINFVSPNCPHCQEQLPILNRITTQLVNGPYRFINVSSVLQPELVQLSPNSEWIEDKEGKLRELFKVLGYPTLFVMGKEGKIDQIIPGVSDQLNGYLLTHLIKPKG